MKNCTRILALFLACVMVLSLTACGKQKEPASNPEQKTDTSVIAGENSGSGISQFQDENYNWITITEAYYPFDAGYQVGSFAQSNSTILISGSNGTDNRLVLADYQTSYTDQVSLSNQKTVELNDPQAADEAEIYAVAAGADGFFYVLTGEKAAEENPDFSGSFRVLKYDASGNFAEQMSFQYLSPYQSPMRGLTVTEDGRILVNSLRDYLILSWGGDIQYSESNDITLIYNFQICSDGIYANVLNNGGANPGFHYVQLGSDGKYSFINTQEDGSITNCSGFGGRFLANNGNDFFYMDFSTGERKDVLSWNFGNQVGGSCLNVCQLSDNAFAYTMSDTPDALTLISSVAREDTAQSTVKVALCGAEKAEADIMELNNGSSEYSYECVAYEETELDRLLTEISTGNGPDLILYNGNIDTRSASFEDLYAYIDADPDLTREAFLPHLLKALETNGELHEIWTGVQISTLAARTSDVGNGSGLTTADYDRILQESGRYQAVFQSFMTGSNLLSWIANISSGEYIDWSTGTCHFTDPSFADLLAWCKEMAPEYEGEQAVINYDLSEVLLSFETLSDARRVTAIRENFGEPITFVGFPCTTGQGHYYASAAGCSAAIPSNSTNKEGAWAFIRAQLLTEKQISSYPLDGFPVIYDAFQRATASVLDEPEYNALLDLVNNTTKAISYGDKQVHDIILEAGNGYLSGGKTIEDTVSAIQSRIGIYVAEKIG